MTLLVVHTVLMCISIRGATGAARAPKPGKTPIMAARRRRLLFFKIEVRPRSCRSYHIWRPCLTYESYVPGCKPISEETKPSDFESNEKEITFGKTIENANP